MICVRLYKKQLHPIILVETVNCDPAESPTDKPPSLFESILFPDFHSVKRGYGLFSLNYV